MKIITISREFGSGGRELGKRLADIMNFDYYDNEIISSVAKKSGMEADYIEKVLSNHGWQEQKITLRSTLGSSTYLQSQKIDLLLQQKKVIEDIVALNKNCIIIGRNADIILKEYQPFNIFVCADMNAKIKRCKKYSSGNENFSEKELIRKIKLVDKTRLQTRELLTNYKWGQRDAYHLTINTTAWEIKELAPAVADFAENWFTRKC